MTVPIRKLVGTAILAAMMTTGGRAQAPVPGGPRYVIAYLEVMPTAANEGAALAREMRDAMRREAGNLRGEALQRIGRPNQLVILSAWKDQAALDAHAKAGPTARLTLTPTLFAATASGRSCLGTSWGTIDCHAGAVSAAPVSTRKVKNSNLPGVTRSSQTSAASAVELTVMKDSTTISRRRLSTMSASAPASSANRKIGRLVAT